MFRKGLEVLDRNHPKCIADNNLKVQDKMSHFYLTGIDLKGGDAITAEHYYLMAIKRQPEVRDWREGLAKSQDLQDRKDTPRF